MHASAYQYRDTVEDSAVCPHRSLVHEHLVGPLAHGSDGLDRTNAVVGNEDLPDGSGASGELNILLERSEGAARSGHHRCSIRCGFKQKLLGVNRVS